jgi:hypothetical protein
MSKNLRYFEEFSFSGCSSLMNELGDEELDESEVELNAEEGSDERGDGDVADGLKNVFVVPGE